MAMRAKYSQCISSDSLACFKEFERKDDNILNPSRRQSFIPNSIEVIEEECQE